MTPNILEAVCFVIALLLGFLGGLVFLWNFAI